MAVTVEMRTQVSQLYYALFGRAPDAEGLGYWVQQLSGGKTVVSVADDMFAVDAARAYYPAFSTNEELVESFYLNTLGRVADAEGLAYWTAALNAPGATPGSVITDLIYAVVGYSGTDAAALTSQQLFNNKVTVGQYYGENNGDIAGATSALVPVTADAASVPNAIAAIDASGVASGLTFTLTEDTAAGADVMRLTGDMDARIDVTVNNNQVKGLDLNGNGVIETNGVENNNPTTLDNGKDFEIVDAYVRDRLNLSNLNENFLGDIGFDGTGFDGDGVTTDGNIFLGGLGADLAFGGIGNDFMVGGGVIDSLRPSDTNENGIIEVGETATFSDDLHGGRNADFFFAEFSTLDMAEGDNLFVDGGSTSDDAAVGNNTAQDSDWFLVEASDDEEPYTIDLSDENDQFVTSTAGHTGTEMWEIENIDASGNLYGFLDDVDVALGEGGLVVDGENVGIGSSAQLNIIGSVANNILIGGYDNDRIAGATGNDLLMGGNLNYLNNVNLLEVVNNGMDELFGEAGDDNIVFEADGGIIDGGVGVDAIPAVGQEKDDNYVPGTPATPGSDTLWLTRESLGTVAAANASTVITDGVVRIELENGDADTDGNDTFAGTGGADVDGTADQTNYIDSDMRVNLDNMENVIATGLGDVDYQAAGTNDPELNFNNQQNHFAYNGDLNLRGTDGVNILYAAGGADVLEGREGGTLTTDAQGKVTATGDNRDMLSGGAQADDFIFALGNNSASVADGVDVIHRQTDANNDNLWDEDADGNRLYGQDFGLDADSTTGVSVLQIKIAKVGGNAPTDELDDVVNFVSEVVTGVKVGATFTAITLNTAEIKAATTYQGLTDAINNALDATAFGADLQATLQADGITVFITDALGRELADTATEVPGAGVTVNQKANTQTENVFSYGEPLVTVIEDRLIYASYEDRSDNELVDDNSYTGSTISLGTDAYAEDLVVDFSADGTRIAEDQSYELTFDNLTTEDTVEITVNGVKYSLRVGVDLDGNELADEELLGQGGTAADQEAIQTTFLDRMAGFIETFMDDDTAAGKVLAVANGNTITLTQVDYNGEETVFMSTPTVVLGNQSTGEAASVTVTNNSQHEVHLLDFNGRDGALNEENVLFIGNMGVDYSRATLETGKGAAGTANTMNSSEAIIVDGGANTLQAVVFGTTQAIADNTATNSLLRADFTVHGDDLLITGVANDSVSAGTGDDRVIGSLGTDTVDGGKSYYAVKVLGEAQARVYVMNQWEAQNPTKVTALNGLTVSSINRIADSESGLAVVGSSTGTAEVYNDTLQFEQADFAAKTNFTVTLDGFTGSTASTLEFRNAGAGKVSVDNAGDGTVDSTTTFTNFENIRTVSGTGNAVAKDGQGNDTLDVSALSTAAGGISYDLTNAATAGDVRYSANASINQLALAAGQTASVLVGATVASVKAAIVNAHETAAFQSAVNAIPVTATTTIAGFLASVSSLALLTRPTSVADTQVNIANATTDYETQVIKVDGVENVIGGSGADLLMIDETEAAKDNSFMAGTGNDRVEYSNDFAPGSLGVVATAAATFMTTAAATADQAGETAFIAAITAAGATAAQIAAANQGANTAAASFAAFNAETAAQALAEDYSEPTVTIKLDNIAAVSSASSGTDTVTMTGGRVGTTVAVDTLVAVERITLGLNTAEGKAEADVIDVTAMTAGAVVDYTNGQVRDLTGQVHVTIEGITEMETVLADGNDKVIVADAAVMNDNARSDENQTPTTPAENILFMSYLDFDDKVSATSTVRKTFAAQVSDSTAQTVINQGQFTFSLSEVGTDADVDRVDYSAEQGRIIAAVGQGSATTPQYIIVDGDSDAVSSSITGLADAESRVDVLESVEEIVASLGESVLDFTTVNAARQITFQYNTAIANPAENGVVEETIRIADGSGNTISGLNAFVEKYTYNKTTAPVADATWNRVEGGDLAEVVIYQGSEDLVNQAGLDHRYSNDTLTLRGGNNEVRYSPIETSVTAAITVTEENLTTLGTAEGLISAVVTFQDGIGGALAGGGTHTITSYSSDNSTAVGNLKIEGSQDAEDTVSFTTSSQKVFVLGTSPGVINVNIGALNAIVLTGFERLQDSASNDVYDFKSMTAIAGVTIVDDSATASADHDVIKVVNDAINYNGAGANTIDLDNLGATVGGFNFDFDVLDVTSVTNGSLILNGGSNDSTGADAGPTNATESGGADSTDEVVLGNLSLVTSIADFETMVMTQATTAGGTTFGFNAATNQLTQGSTTVTTSANVLSFGGLVRELTTATVYGKSTVADVTTGVTVNVAGVAGAEVHGGAGADVLNGSDGADILRGGAGNDTLNGGVSSEVRFTQINPTGAAGATGTAITVTLDGFVLTLNNLTVPVDVDADAGNNLDIAPAGGSNAVGAALATLINANLADINDGVRFDGVQLLNAAYSDSTGNLTYTFAAGTDVAITDTIVVAGAGLGAITVTNDNLVSNGGAAGNDTYIVDSGTDTISALNASDILQVYTGATATASGVSAFTATAATQNLGTVTITSATSGSVINLALAAAASTLGGVASTATNGFTVVGGAGVDTITGSVKDDVMSGGAGADVFNIGSGQYTVFDTISGFATGSDQLNMVLAGAVGNYLEVDGSSLTFAQAQSAAQAQFNGTIGHVFVYNVAGDGYLFSDVNLGGAQDGAIKLVGLTSAAGLDSADII